MLRETDIPKLSTKSTALNDELISKEITSTAAIFRYKEEHQSFI